MSHLIHSSLGFIHLAFSCIAMIMGVWVLILKKGTQLHKRIGYVYVTAMLGVNGTALFIYQLWGRFGIFHWFAMLSLVTLLAGMYPIWARKSANSVSLHLSFMYWSVVGLYCAFVAEMLVRVPGLAFHGRLMLSLNVGTFVVMASGGVLFAVLKRRWEALK